MRARNIKPGFFSSEQLADCSDAAQILFAGLWCLADREGFLQDRPRTIKAEVFPHKDRDVDMLLNELVSAQLITRYESSGVRCICIPNFRKHQRPHQKEVAFGLPKPIKANTNLGTTQPDLGTASTNLNPASCAECGMMNDECGMLNVESADPKKVEPKEPSPEELARRALYRSDEKHFERFRKTYPHKIAMEIAARVWRSLSMDESFDPDAVLAALGKQIASGQLEPAPGASPLHPATWLDGKRWEDDIRARSPPRQSTPSQQPMTAAAMLRLLDATGGQN